MKIKFSALVLILMMICTACGNDDRFQTYSGTVESTQIDINSEVSGKLISILKDEGDIVNADETVAVIDSSNAMLQVNQAEAAYENALAKLDEIKSGSRKEQIKQAEAAVKAAKSKLDELKAGSRNQEIQQAQAALNQAEESFDSARKNYDYRVKNLENLKQLYSADGASKQQVDDARNLVDIAKQQMDNAKEQVSIADSRLALLKEGATPQAIMAAEANYEQALAQLELLKNGATSQTIASSESAVKQAEAALNQAKLNLSKCNITSPIAGTFLYKSANIGDIIMPGTNIGTVSDLSDLWVKIFIPQRHINKVQLGQEVSLSTISLPDTKIKGKIIFISSEAEFTPKNTETTESRENTVFKVKIKIMDNIDKLKPGMTIDATISVIGG